MQSQGAEDALELSIHAAVVAFCAKESFQYHVLCRTRTMYGRALGSQSRLVGRLKNSTKPTPRLLCTTVMLSYYEAMNGTTPGGYIRHLDGVARMLELVGAMYPRIGQSNFLHSSDTDGKPQIQNKGVDLTHAALILDSYGEFQPIWL